jgi:hypothetical protein
MTQRRALTPLDRRVDRGGDVAANLRLRDGDQVTLNVDVLGRGTATVGLYGTDGSLREEVLTGAGRRRLEVDVERDTDTPHLLFLSARETAVDVEVTVLR